MTSFLIRTVALAITAFGVAFILVTSDGSAYDCRSMGSVEVLFAIDAPCSLYETHHTP